MTRLRSTVAIAMIAVLAASCGADSSGEEGAPVGEPVLPNLVPAAPTVIQMQRKGEDGRWELRFTSVLVNVGEGDFELAGSRTADGWTIEQLVEYSGGGAERTPTDARLVWGGDGHGHWHIERVATYRLEPIDEAGEPIAGATSRTDTKVGFCFFDSDKELDRGPDDAQYFSEGCGHEDADEIDMGLSPGWGDTYVFSLPGQGIDIDDLPDGRYRLWAEADEQGWFIESDRDDNRTWADLELGTIGDVRTAGIVGRGPEPS